MKPPNRVGQKTQTIVRVAHQKGEPFPAPSISSTVPNSSRPLTAWAPLEWSDLEPWLSASQAVSGWL